ncbi:MAG: LysR family transcriptional regulator [Rhodospirillum sp.]|nr:LysR family transcriptional regulator [Rhodospirillum sp.]MCF8490090.1 LysR family transcriptional regulator [Rhodospirillum sp.]MCF8502325.1 LysR family transcriptional regulator [Rhodospirillum sp.]
MNWEDLRHFLALAEGGSLSAAARTLGVEHSTVARRVAALERDLGARLVDRLPRSILLTEAGRRVARLGAGVSDGVARVVRGVDALEDSLAGAVTVSAPPSLAGWVIAKALADLRARHPRLVVTLLGEVERADLDRRRADIALRLSRPEQPDLVARKVGELVFRFYGAPGFVPREKNWPIIGYEETTAHYPQWRWLEPRLAGRPVVFRSNDLTAHAVAARGGLGVALLPRFMGEEAGLVVLASQESPPSRDIWMVVHDDLRSVPRVRLVMDELARIVGDV